MTKQKDKKRHIRQEMERTGKSYATVRAEVDGPSPKPPRPSPYDGLRLWRQCVQAVGWSPFTKSDEDMFEYFPNVEEYANEEVQRILEDAELPKETAETVRAFAGRAAQAARELDPENCLANLERADLLLTQAGWEPEIVRFGLESLRSDYDVDANERLIDGPITANMRVGDEARPLNLDANDVYRVRGARPVQPAAGRLCRLRLFDHFIPAEAVVEYVDNHRFGVFSIEDLEAVSSATPSRG